VFDPFIEIYNCCSDCEPQDPAKKEFAEELFSCSGSFSKSINSTFKGEADEAGECNACCL
jgi:glutathione S-transferase